MSDNDLVLLNTETTAEKFIEIARAETGRSCGECSMCCKLLPINKPEFSKPANVWCKHCRPGAGGCTIYNNDRPLVCRNFACQWLVDPGLSEAWHPLRSHIVAHFTNQSRLTLNFVVDPNTPNRWREEPYYALIKNVAHRGLAGTYQHSFFVTQVDVGNRTWIITPDDDVEVDGDSYMVLPTGPDKWGVIHNADADKMQRLADGLQRFDEMVERLSPAERASFAASLEEEGLIR